MIHSMKGKMINCILLAPRISYNWITNMYWHSYYCWTATNDERQAKNKR